MVSYSTRSKYKRFTILDINVYRFRLHSGYYGIYYFDSYDKTTKISKELINKIIKQGVKYNNHFIFIMTTHIKKCTMWYVCNSFYKK